MTKRCAECKLDKPADTLNFYRCYDGELHPVCKLCWFEISIAKHKENGTWKTS